MSILQDHVTHGLPYSSTWISQSIITTPLSVCNRAGRNISAYLDSRSDARSCDGVVILVPGYGKTKTSHLRLAYYFALNGFRVVRYDHTNHVGDSEGSMLFTTLSQMEEDLASVIDFVDGFNPACIGLVAESLGARVALKRASNDDRVRLFISIMGVFDVQDTLRKIYAEDGFIEKANGGVLGIRDIMGFQVDADRFIQDAQDHMFHTVESAIQDVEKLRIPTFFFASEKDPWVSQETVSSVFAVCRSKIKALQFVSGIMHELYEQPEVAADTCKDIVLSTKLCLEGGVSDSKRITVPVETTVISRLRVEKRRTSKDLKTEEEKVFWAQYLEKYANIVKLQDYWNLLDSIAVNLGIWKTGDKILDAGCGIGTLGTFLLVRNLYQATQLRAVALRKKPLVHYVGVDFVEAAIRQARALHQEIYGEFVAKLEWLTTGKELLDFSYSVGDLDRGLPFKDEHFDKIAANLVLSYVKDPAIVIAEFCRTLKVQGRIVISSLKPNADLSQIYRDYISVSRTNDELEEARQVLSNAGLVRYKEAEGLYHFFSESEIKDLLREVGCSILSSFRSFGDQANVVVGQKLA